MTQEDKELLFQDLSARLPYGVKFPWNYAWDQETSVIEVLEEIDKDGYIDEAKIYSVEDIKPYLRPMSSMTKEEKEEYCNLQDKFLCSSQYPVTDAYELFDWLNVRHFDYRNLIEKGLAIAVTKENNPYKH